LTRPGGGGRAAARDAVRVVDGYDAAVAASTTQAVTRGPRFGVVGAGILGLAIARRLTRLVPGAQVTVLDKEQHVAAHQTGHNSGVAHAGLYYAPGSLKATLCRRGMSQLRDLCQERGLPYDECGKLVVARNDGEVGRLREIERRATANGVPGLRWIAGGALREIEPNVAGVAALHSPRTAIVDFAAIARSLATDVTAAGTGTLLLGHEVTGIAAARGEVRVTATGGVESAFDHLVICAGLHADRVARLAGDDAGPAIIPFRGEYLRLKAARSDLVRGLIYPVPDPALPFLGVHFTRRVDGTVEVGPNAVLAFAREGYRRTDLAFEDLAETLRWPGFRRLVRRHWRSGLRELHGSLSRRAFLREAREFIPSLERADVEPAPAGVRAQAVDRDGSLVDDFRISRVGRIVAVRNAPSPAATSSLAIAEHVTAQMLER
jgi:L-2-hydroxyglutarate oxidase LhgO